jgi:CheY-like chemotaxis protein
MPRRVLVVDDDEYNRLLLMRYLPSPPFTVETAVHGLAATEAIARQWPDIVLIDMEMPLMDGPAVRGSARANTRKDARREWS